MSGMTYYKKNRDVTLSRAKDYYKNDNERLRKKTRGKYKNLSEEDRNKKKKNMEQTDIIICLKKKNKN